MKYIKLLPLLFIYACSVQPKQDVKITINTDSKNYGSTITNEDLKAHLSVLASDEYEGRETGQPGQKLAAEYIKNYFKELGLTPGNNGSYFQHFPLEVKDPRNVFITVSGNEYIFLEDFYQFGGLPDTTIIGNQIVDLGYGINESDYSNYTNKKIEGKLVLIKSGMPENTELKKTWNWRNKRDEAQKNGATAVFYYDEDFKENLEPIKQYINNPQLQLHDKGRKKSKTTPFFIVSPKIYETITSSSTIDSDYKTNYKLKLRTNAKEIVSENVLGFLEGTDKKEEIVVITAHYDHIGYDNGEICNGADDDGSGTVSVLEIAEAFVKAKAEGKGPRRSLLFMTVSGEEKGLLGSRYYTDNPVYPLENTVVDLNIDMVGRVDSAHIDNPDYVYVIGADKLSTELHLINEGVNKAYSNLNLDYTYNDENDPNRFYYRSDHYNFAKNNIPIIFYFNGTHEDYHKATDEVDKINFSVMESRARLVFHTAWEIVNREEKIRLDSKQE